MHRRLWRTTNMKNVPNKRLCCHFNKKLSNSTISKFGTRNGTMNGVFTSEAVKNFIKRYNTSKTCGFDGIHTKLLRALETTSLPGLLAALLQRCSDTGLTPRRWNESLVYPLKKKDNGRRIEDCRCISLSSMFRRTFVGILLNFIQGH
jgi:hypothetical protein